MSAAQIPEPGDDWMAVADAVGVTAPAHPELLLNFRAHPSRRHEFTDDGLAAILANWSRAAAGLDEPDLAASLADTIEAPAGYVPPVCRVCGDTGIATAYDGSAISCTSCDGGIRW